MAVNKVPKDNVTFTQIQEVLKDFTTIPDTTKDRNINAIDIFRSPAIKAPYIDPEWCDGVDEDARKVELSIEDPVSCYDYINYGGEDTEDTEIYFSNLISWTPGATELIEGNQHDFSNTYPVIPFYPNTSALASYYKNNPSLYPGDENAYYASSFYRKTAPEFLEKYGFSAKVGCDYGNNPPADVKFRVKVTIVLADDYMVDLQRYYNKTSKELTPDPWLPVAGLVGGAIGGDALAGVAFTGGQGPLTDVVSKIAMAIPETAAGSLLLAGMALYAGLRIGVAVADLIWDLTAVYDVKSIEEGWNHWKICTGGNYSNFDVRRSEIKVTTGIKNTGSDDPLTVIGSDYEYETGIINIRNPKYSNIYGVNFINNPTFAGETDWIVFGTVNIADGKLAVSGDERVEIYQAVVLPIGEQFEASITVVNQGAASSIQFSLSNIPDAVIIEDLATPNSSGTIRIRGTVTTTHSVLNIILLTGFSGYVYEPTIVALPKHYPGPTVVNNVLQNDNWYNFEVKPRGVQYDKVCPPPATMYIVELIPVSGCKVSTDPHKPHIFAMMGAPDKGNMPNYDVIPRPNIPYNAMVRLQDAIYADYIFLRDLEPSSQLFGSYENISINTPAYKNNTHTANHPFVGNDIITFGSRLANGYSGRYNVIFMKEGGVREQPLVFNKDFIDRGYGLDRYTVIRKYWNFNNQWVIRAGAAYKKVNIQAIFTQLLENMTPTANWDALYRFEIVINNCTSGKAFIELSGNFTNALYRGTYDVSFNLAGNPKHVNAVTLPTNEYNPGVTLVGSKVYFDVALNNTGKFIVFLKANKTINNILTIGGTDTFNGGIARTMMRRLSARHPDDSDRYVILADFNVNIGGGSGSRTLYLLYDKDSGNTLNGELNNLELLVGKFIVDVTVVITFGRGTTDKYGHLGVQTLTLAEAATQYVYYNFVDSPDKYNLITIELTEWDPIWDSQSINDSNYVPGGTYSMQKLEVHNKGIIDIADYYGMLYNADVDLSNCNLGNFSSIDQFTNNWLYSRLVLDTRSNLQYVPMLSRFNGLDKLNLSNNPIKDDLYFLGVIKSLVNFTNTNIFGDLAELSTVSDTIKLDGSNVQYYGSVPRMGCKNIWWQNMQKPMVVSDLEFLVRDLYESSVRGGQLFIAGTNPNIEDEEILYFIFKLVHDEDWVVVYNGYYITAANRDNYLQSGTDDYLYTHNY